MSTGTRKYEHRCPSVPNAPYCNVARCLVGKGPVMKEAATRCCSSAAPTPVTQVRPFPQKAATPRMMASFRLHNSTAWRLLSTYLQGDCKHRRTPTLIYDVMRSFVRVGSHILQKEENECVAAGCLHKLQRKTKTEARKRRNKKKNNSQVPVSTALPSDTYTPTAASVQTPSFTTPVEMNP